MLTEFHLSRSAFSCLALTNYRRFEKNDIFLERWSHNKLLMTCILVKFNFSTSVLNGLVSINSWTLLKVFTWNIYIVMRNNFVYRVYMSLFFRLFFTFDLIFVSVLGNRWSFHTHIRTSFVSSIRCLNFRCCFLQFFIIIFKHKTQNIK